VGPATGALTGGCVGEGGRLPPAAECDDADAAAARSVASRACTARARATRSPATKRGPRSGQLRAGSKGIHQKLWKW
jgi:hypothetical protein